MYHKWVVKEEYSTNSTPVLLNKWWDTDRYIDVGYIDSPEYLTTIPKEGTYYVTINKNTGKIDWIYEFDNTSNSWIKYSPSINADGTVEKNFDTFNLTFRADESLEKTVVVNAPNEYSKTSTSEYVITKKEVGDSVTVTLSVTPQEGYVVDYWTENSTKIEDSEGLTTITVNMDNSQAYRAIFKQNAYVKSINIDGDVQAEQIVNGLDVVVEDLESKLTITTIEEKTITFELSITGDPAGKNVTLGVKDISCTWSVNKKDYDNPALVSFSDFDASNEILLTIK